MESVKSIIEIVHSLKEIFRNTREKRKISRKKTREKQIFKAHRKQRLNLTKINTRNDMRNTRKLDFYRLIFIRPTNANEGGEQSFAIAKWKFILSLLKMRSLAAVEYYKTLKSKLRKLN